MTATFPAVPLGLTVEMLLKGQWINFGPFTEVSDDYYTDLYEDVYAGRLRPNYNRLPYQAITITHGRPDESSRVRPARVSVLLWNDDGWLTPGDPRSPWFPDVDLDAPFRILVDESVVFHGKVAEIRPEWPFGDLSTGGNPLLDEDDEPLLDEDDQPLLDEIVDPGYAHVFITAAGIIRELGIARPLRSPIARAVLAPDVAPHIKAYWTFEEGSDATEVQSHAPEGGVAAVIDDGVRLGQDSTHPGSEPLAQVPSGTSGKWSGRVNSGPSGTWQVGVQSFVDKRPVAGEVTVLSVATTGTTRFWRVVLTPTHLVVRRTDQMGGVVESGFPYPGRVTNRWVGWRLSVRQDGGSAVWSVSWRSPGQLPLGYSLTDGSSTVGAVTRLAGAKQAETGVSWSFGHPYVADEDDVWFLLAAEAGHVGEHAMDRYVRLCAEEGISAHISYRENDSETQPMGPQGPLRLLELLQECAETDGGVLCEQRDGYGLVMFSRAAFYHRTPSWTLDAKDSDIANPYEPVLDDYGLTDSVTASKPNGSSMTVGPDDPVRPTQITSNPADDSDLEHAAGWARYLGAARELRFPRITMDLGIRPERIPTWLLRRVGAMTKITGMPPQHPPGDVEAFLQGWTETLSPFSWRVEMNQSPAKPWGRVFIVEDPVYGRVVADMAALVFDIDEDDTSFQVASIPIWITTASHPTQFPFDARIDGEVMTVTGITGGASPQTWTVTRGVNGITAAHTSGTAVALAVEPVLAR